MLRLLTFAAAILFGLSSAHAATLDDVKKKGFVSCGVNVGLGGFSMPDSKGVWKGLDVDACRAVASAVFADPDKVKFVPTTGTSSGGSDAPRGLFPLPPRP